MKSGRLFLTFAVAAILAAALSHSPPPAHANGEIEIVSSSVESEFPQGIRFKAQIDSKEKITEVAVSFRIGQQIRKSFEYLDFEVEAGDELLDSELFFRTAAAGSYIPPGTLITYRFEVEDESGNRLETEEKQFVYHDPRFEWTELSEGPITVIYHGPVKRRAEAIL